eukprot:181774_1
MVGEAEGIYHVKIHCVSESPSYAPITAHPTHGPSLEPSTSPITSKPTTAIPTVLQTAAPTMMSTVSYVKETEQTKENKPSLDIILVGLVAVIVIVIGAILLIFYCFHIERRKVAQRNQNMAQKELQQGAKVRNNNIIDMDLSDCLDYYNQTTTGSGQVRRPMASLFVAKQGSDVVDEVEGVHNVEMKRTVEGPRGETDVNHAIPDKKNTEIDVTSGFGNTTKGDIIDDI